MFPNIYEYFDNSEQIIIDSLKKLEESGYENLKFNTMVDESEMKFCEKLYEKYKILKDIYSFNYENIVDYDKYGLKHLSHYFEFFVEPAKTYISEVIRAISNGEPIDPFYKNEMFNYLYFAEYLEHKDEIDPHYLEEEVNNEKDPDDYGKKVNEIRLKKLGLI